MKINTIMEEANIQINNRIKKYTLMKNGLIEKRINLCIKQKPKYIPLKLWCWLLSKMLYIEIFK